MTVTMLGKEGAVVNKLGGGAETCQPSLLTLTHSRTAEYVSLVTSAPCGKRLRFGSLQGANRCGERFQVQVPLVRPL